MKSQSYRASVAGIIVNEKKEFLLTQLQIARRDEYDFVKGGMDPGENEIETLKREIKEELGKKIDFDIIQKSEVYIIYEWPEHLKKNSGFRGQARISFWVFYRSGELKLAKRELRLAEWVPESKLFETLQKGHFRDFILEAMWKEWESIKRNYPKLFKK